MGDEMGRVPAHYAALNNDEEALKDRSANGADLGASDLAGFTPLHLACQESSLEAARYTFTVASDGRKDALVCWGKGQPAVLLETGGTNIEEWTGSSMISELAPITRVCTYDRAGTGKSDAAPNKRRDADDVVNEANALLKAAHVDGPLVLLGRSFGGMVVTHYAEMLPDDVVGVVVLDTPAPSAEFTEKSEPELVWNAPGNTEHLDVVGGFENRFAKDPPHFDAPLLVITPAQGEASAKNESFWLQASPDSTQVELNCGEEGECATEVAKFVKSLGTS